MALGREMKRAARRVADVLGAYARKRGWWPAGFRVYVRDDDSWGNLHFILVSDGFEGVDEYESYRLVMSYLNHRLDREPDLLATIHLAVQTFKQVAEGGLYAIGEDYQRVRPRDLAVRALNEAGDLILAFARARDWGGDAFRLLFQPEDASDRLRMILVLCDSKLPVDQIRREIQAYLDHNLSDQPDIHWTLQLEVAEETQGFGGTVSPLEWNGSRLLSYSPA